MLNCRKITINLSIIAFLILTSYCTEPVTIKKAHSTDQNYNIINEAEEENKNIAKKGNVQIDSKKLIQLSNISKVFGDGENNNLTNLEVYDEYFDGDVSEATIIPPTPTRGVITAENSIEFPQDHPIYSKITKRIPRNNQSHSLEVKCGFYVESLGNFRATEMTFDIDLYFYMSWQDTTLAHNSSDYIPINDKEVLDMLWVPDLYFSNARSAYFHTVTVPNFNMYIRNDGTISYGTRVTLNVACNLDLKNYPLDQQRCVIKIISYAHVLSEMNATWFSVQPISFNPEIGLPEFKITGMNSELCNGTFRYTLTDESYRIGDFSCLLGVIELDRAIGYHLVQSYIPSSLIVLISFVSFYIDRRAIPARVSLSFTALLTLSTQGNGMRFQVPAVAYAKAIDLFYGICMLFIFGVLVEFALVNSYMRKANKYNSMAQNWQHISTPVTNRKKSYMNGGGNSNGYTEASGMFSGEDTETEDTMAYLKGKTEGHEFITQTELIYKAMFYNRRALSIDQVSRVLFPGFYLCFNGIYWYYYLGYAKKDTTATL